MRKKIRYGLLFFLFLLASFFCVKNSIACENFSFPADKNPIEFNFNNFNLIEGETYFFYISSYFNPNLANSDLEIEFKAETNNVIKIDKITRTIYHNNKSIKTVSLLDNRVNAFNGLSIPDVQIKYILSKGIATKVCDDNFIYINSPNNKNRLCTATITNLPTIGYFKTGETVHIEGTIKDLFNVKFMYKKQILDPNYNISNQLQNGNDTFSWEYTIQEIKGLHIFDIYAVNFLYKNIGSPLCTIYFSANEPMPPINPNTPIVAIDICKFAGNEFTQCAACFATPGVWTPFGCIETNMQKMVENVLKIAISLGGGIAFLMVIYGGFMTMMSAGNPEKLNSGKEIITSAIVGLLLIVFSAVILKIIGVDIFNIPNLGGT